MYLDQEKFSIEELEYYYLQGYKCECEADNKKILISKERQLEM